MLPVINVPASPKRPISDEFVTLVRPAKVSSAGTWSIPFTPPLGLAYLAAMLRREGARVAAIDAIAEKYDQFVEEDGFLYQGLTIPEIIDRIDPRTTIIGVTCMFSQDWPYCRRLITALKRRFPNVLMVAGGEHMTAITEYNLRDCPDLDLCVLGEGEETIVDVVRHAHNRLEWPTIDGICYLEDGQVVRTRPRQRITDVDGLPMPAWDLFPMEVYVSSDNSFGVNRGRSIAILATRGCPYKCTFCSNPAMYGKMWEARSPDNVLDEIEYDIKHYNVENVDFFDLTMVLKREWILDFCRKMEERGLNITWQLPSGTRSEVIDDEVARALYRTGARNVTYAPESGSVDTLKTIKKQVNLDRLLESIRCCLRAKLHVKCNIIIGFPHEVRRDVWHSLTLSWRMALMGIDAVEAFVFTPYPGTQLFDELQSSGVIKGFNDDYFRSLAAFQDPYMVSNYCRAIGGRELALWRFFIMLSFFAISFTVRPWRFLRLVMNVIKNRSETVLEHRLGVLVRRPASVDAAGSLAESAAAR